MVYSAELFLLANQNVTAYTTYLSEMCASDLSEIIWISLNQGFGFESLNGHLFTQIRKLQLKWVDTSQHVCVKIIKGYSVLLKKFLPI